MTLKDILKLYEGMEHLHQDGSSPMEQIMELREQVHATIEETLRWYLDKDSFAARRLSAEVRTIREVLLEFQLVLEGIAIADGKDGT